MADDTSPGASLEPEDHPQAPAAPAAPAPAPAPAVAGEGEPEAVEVGGQKMVPLSALLAERGEKKQLKERAARADQLEDYARQVDPYVQFIKANPGLMAERTKPAPAEQPAEDTEAADVARMFDFYTSDGKPDVQRGRAHLNLVDQRAMKQAQAIMAPVAQATAQERSATNFQRALQITDVNGQKVNPEALRAVWQNMPVEYTADPRTAGVLAATAAGMTALYGKKAIAPPPNPPLVTESPGGAPRRAAPLTELDKTIAANRGISETKFAELTAGFRSGRSNVLED